MRVILILAFGIINIMAVKGTTVPRCSEKVEDLGIDQAYLNISRAGFKQKVLVQTLSQECYSCGFQDITYIDVNQSSCTVIIDTRWYMKIKLIGMDDTKFGNCSDNVLDKHYMDGGHYYTVIESSNDSIWCVEPYLTNDVADSNIPVYVAIGIIAALCVLWAISIRVQRSRLMARIIYTMSPSIMPDPLLITDHNTPTHGILDSEIGEVKTKERLKSLDTFRGVSLVIMIFVNYGGGHYWYFNHSKWNGLTVADLVMPWFVWIMGTAMAFSFRSINQQGTRRLKIFLKILRRSVVLFALGLFVSSHGKHNPIDFTEIRIMGVLQRLSLSYLVVATVHLLCTAPMNENADMALRPFRDILNYWQEWIIHLMLLMIHTLLTFFLKVPGCPTGYLGPGGLADDGQHPECTGGAAGYIDRHVFGENHLYTHATCIDVFETTVKPVSHRTHGLHGWPPV